MSKQYTGAFLKVTLAALVAFGINTLLYAVPQLDVHNTGFEYPLWGTYLFFYIFSMIIVGVLIKVSQKSAAQVGYAFLLLTGIKMAGAYVMARPILAKTVANTGEKTNFLIVFVLFLAIEAYFTVGLLNNKQQTPQ